MPVTGSRPIARRRAGLHRAGELTAIAVPSPAQEAVRDLCRTRGDMVQDLTREFHAFHKPRSESQQRVGVRVCDFLAVVLANWQVVEELRSALIVVEGIVDGK